ncbi:MAG: hypothetical protein WBP73_03640 [Terriglobales bacterium]
MKQLQAMLQKQSELSITGTGWIIKVINACDLGNTDGEVPLYLVRIKLQADGDLFRGRVHIAHDGSQHPLRVRAYRA